MVNKIDQQNKIEWYRRRMRLKPRNVAFLLGHKQSSVLADYERGARRPSLANAFKLSIILRVPVEFLYPGLYESLRECVRAMEERQSRPAQQSLFSSLNEPLR